MSIDGNQQLARNVASAIEEWTPSEAYDHESKFQNELQEYLDRRLNSGGNMMLGPSQDVVVEREHGNVNGDVVVNGDIGIEMKRNLTNSQTKKLRGQIEEYQKEYTHVIPVACGIDDMDGWRKLKNDYENQTGIGMDPSSAPVRFIHKNKSNYGEGDTAENYDYSGGGGQQGAELAEIANVIEDGMKGYQSLTGDGPMDSGEAVTAFAQAVLIVGFLIAVVAIILLNML
ncbi:hypothetical protein [Halorubrum laminariae]|uniref:Restriction endonuclease type IV Mrr domain-containing protein n=1 Tax=Halorubrum laminariae TaxID=1433523 RepID=A0ABD6BXM3_9EURY|nr:hypothetical protein [Halorubrum laminariae]